MTANDDQQEKPKRGPVLCNRRVDGPYTVLPNAIVQGDELTPEAFRLLAFIASLPDDWNLRIAQAAKKCRMGRDRAYVALKELELGTYARHVVKRSAEGRLVSRSWEFTLTPGKWRELDPENQDEARRTSYWNSGTRKKRPHPEIQEKANQPHPEKPDQATPTLQRNKRDKDKRLVGGGAPPAAAWPFSESHKATVAVRNLGLQVEAVWQQYLTTSLASPPENLPAYLVGIAKRMAKQEPARRTSTGSPATVSMGAAINAEIAFAERNITVKPSGKVVIGEEFRAELRETYTDSQIERGLERAPSQGGATPAKLLTQIRRCCSYAKQDDDAVEKRLAASKGQSSRKTFTR